MEVSGNTLGRLAVLIRNRMHPPMARQAQPMRIVVVDDSPTALRTVCSYLRTLPGVEIAAAARQAWQGIVLVEELQPDVVLMDIHLPDLSGMDAVGLMSREFPGLPVIMVTVHDSPEIQHACRQRGAYGFVSKRHLFEQLRPALESLRNQLESHPRRSVEGPQSDC
jgi:two-component system nitrate/nitrite response regulator NarL